MTKTCTIILAALALGACSSSSPSQPSLSEAFCSDLRSGLSLFQIYSGVSDEYTPAVFADRAYGFAAISCPGELKTNEGLRSYLEGWDINPDA